MCQYGQSHVSWCASVLTGALGLMTTVGGLPCRGVAEPLGDGVPKVSPWPACWPWAPGDVAALLGGSGLLRMSFRVEVEDVGVSVGDWVSLLLPEGDAVPSLESLFFLDDLLSLSPLPRDN